MMNVRGITLMGGILTRIELRWVFVRCCVSLFLNVLVMNEVPDGWIELNIIFVFEKGMDPGKKVNCAR